MANKICPNCGKSKSVSEWKNRKSPSGTYYICWCNAKLHWDELK
ncbi:MAG: hypothetical protein ACOCZ5_01890 [bacterium]